MCLPPARPGRQHGQEVVSCSLPVWWLVQAVKPKLEQLLPQRKTNVVKRGSHQFLTGPPLAPQIMQTHVTMHTRCVCVSVCVCVCMCVNVYVYVPGLHTKFEAPIFGGGNLIYTYMYTEQFNH